MSSYIHDNFLLDNAAAERLYHDYAALQPIMDYHCHLPPDRIASNTPFTDITELWLGGDHYKWRAMRANGVPEELITGSASSWDTFQVWAETMPYCLGNPLYHWSHIELKRYFGIDELLDPESAASIYERCNDIVAKTTPRAYIQQSNVSLLCTTDDPTDDLRYHKAMATEDMATKVLPAWRPDKALFIHDVSSWNSWLDDLASVTSISINDWDDLWTALAQQHAFFHTMGCRLSDYGIDTVVAEPWTEASAATAFKRARYGETLPKNEQDVFFSAVLEKLIRLDAAAGWTAQLHLGAQRGNNSRLLSLLGGDCGGDTIGDWQHARPLARLLDRLDKDGALPKTILYNLNPSDNAIMATMVGTFQDGSTAGKIQWGSGWWFLDQKQGMEAQLETLSQIGLLSRFVGMLTDSRSFISYPRHEYFRRILCNKLGTQITKGHLPNDIELVGHMVSNICYQNAEDYFQFLS